MLQRLQKRKESGFTIIEVLIVLAIAGLIMVVVFLAVPALQRSQRNNSRKADANNLASSISEVMSNNGGTFAAGDLATATGNTKFGFYDPLPASSKVVVPGSIDVAATPATDTMYVYPGYKCGAKPTDNPASQTRSTAVVYSVEAGSGSTRQCVSS